mmetsp:Transcript_75090/g.141600  ORF Transcript_75090/g.141600 Transcript_75090/m.141600 type:complete len:205 (+) Transcript_75090:301-915(+)
MEAGLATPWPAISGADPWLGSKRACSRPMFEDPNKPSDPTTPPARSLMMSPQVFGMTSTSYAPGCITKPAQMESTSASSYRMSTPKGDLETARASCRKRPSACFITLALCTAVTFAVPLRRREWLRRDLRSCARRKAYSAMRRLAPRVMRLVASTVSSSTHFSGTALWYKSSVFSRTTRRSMSTSSKRPGTPPIRTERAGRTLP